MAKFKPCNYDQLVMLPISLENQPVECIPGCFAPRKRVFRQSRCPVMHAHGLKIAIIADTAFGSN
jgi:hypothetical protein